MIVYSFLWGKWTFRDQISSQLTWWLRRYRLRSFGVIRISDPRSVWIMVHQRNRWIHDQSGFTSSFDAPWSRQILDHWSGSPQRNAAIAWGGITSHKFKALLSFFSGLTLTYITVMAFHELLPFFIFLNFVFLFFFCMLIVFYVFEWEGEASQYPVCYLSWWWSGTFRKRKLWKSNKF